MEEKLTNMKKYKIIFLDLDGVLNSVRFSEEHYKKTGKPLFMYDFIDPEAVTKMTDFLKTHPNIRLVITSSWRDSRSYKNTVESFQKYGVAPLIPFIIGITGRSRDLNRGYEINHFLQRHNETIFGRLQSEPFEIGEYVVVDDEDFDIAENLIPNFVHVNGNIGITDEDYQKIEEILKEEKKYFTVDEAIDMMEGRIHDMFNNNK